MNPYLEPENEICRLGASALAERIQSGDLSAEEVTRAHIQRIEETDPDINALAIPLFETALEEARQADRQRSRGERLGPLHGVPVSIKEQYVVAGTETTLGAQHQKGKKYFQEGPMVTGLRRAGAVVLGKTNILQTLVGWESDNRIYGRTNNPWDLERTPGGSSGGEAAIVASGGSALGLAGDLGGSIRVPAHFSGVHGLKPTSGRLSNLDFPPGIFSSGQEGIIAQPGPIARSMADLELGFEVMVKACLPGTADLVPPVPWSDPGDFPIEGMRIGFYTDSSYLPVSPALRRAVEEAARVLEARGAVVVPFTPPDMAEAIRIFLGILSAAKGHDYKRLLGDEKPLPQVAGSLQGMYTPSFILPLLSKIMAGRGQNHLADMIKSLGGRSAAEYWQAVEARNAFRAAFVGRMKAAQLDALVCPPFAVPAPRHGQTADLFPAACYALVYNVLGNPAGVISVSSVRAGEETDRPDSRDQTDRTARKVEIGSAGLPVGVQVIGPHWREEIVLAVMKVLEEEFQARPDYPLRAYQPVQSGSLKEDPVYEML